MGASITQVDLSHNHLCGVNDCGHGEYTVEGIQALADALRITTSLTSCNVLKNNMDVAAATLLVEDLKNKNISLCGVQPDQTSAYFSAEGLKPNDAVLLASDLSKAGVSASIMQVDLSYNMLCGVNDD